MARYRRQRRSRRFRKRPRKLWRRVRKSKNSRASRARLPGLIVPDRAFTKMKYQERFVLDPGGGTVSTRSFRGNSVYDPDATGTGIQPTGFDQWSLFYYYFRVYGSKLKCQFISLADNAASQAAVLTIIPALSQTPIADSEDAATNPYAKQIVRNLVNMSNCTLSNYMGTSKISGVSKSVIKNDDQFVGTTAADGGGSNPNEQWWWWLLAESPASSGTSSIQVVVTITYFVEFFGRNFLQTS